MARTLAQVRQLTAQQLGLLYISGTADAGGSTTTLVDDPLKVYPNDRLIGFHILLTSGSPTLTELQITDFVSSSGTATFSPALGAAPDALTYEVLPFSGTDMLRAIQDSALGLYDRGLLVRQFWLRLAAGSPIYNSDWSYWTSTTVVDGWARNGSGTLAKTVGADTGFNEISLRLSGTADWVGLTAEFQRYLWDFRGYTVTLYCPVKTSTASAGRINLYTGSNNYSPYHGGGGAWELLSVEVDISATATAVDVRLVNDTTANVDFGQPFFIGGPPIFEYPFPIGVMPHGPSEVRVSPMRLEKDAIASGRGHTDQRQLWGRQVVLPDYSFTRFHHEDSTTVYGILDLSKAKSIPTDGHRIQVIGDGPLTLPTSATGTTNIEVNQAESLLLATLAAIKLLERALPQRPPSAQAQLRERIAFLTRQFRDIEGGAGQDRGAASLPMRW